MPRGVSNFRRGFVVIIAWTDELLISDIPLFLYTSALPLLFGFAQVKAIGSSLLKCAVLSRLLALISFSCYLGWLWLLLPFPCLFRSLEKSASGSARCHASFCLQFCRFCSSSILTSFRIVYLNYVLIWDLILESILWNWWLLLEYLSILSEYWAICLICIGAKSLPSEIF